MRNVRQHQPLRVPQGWTGQDRALVIQLENILDEIYALYSKVVTDVSYDSENHKITKTINGITTDVMTISEIQAALDSDE